MSDTAAHAKNIRQATVFIDWIPGDPKVIISRLEAAADHMETLQQELDIALAAVDHKQDVIQAQKREYRGAFRKVTKDEAKEIFPSDLR